MKQSFFLAYDTYKRRLKRLIVTGKEKENEDLDLNYLLGIFGSFGALVFFGNNLYLLQRLIQADFYNT